MTNKTMKVSSWPRMAVNLRASDGQVDTTIRVGGVTTVRRATGEETARADVLSHATGLAQSLGRPVILEVALGGSTHVLAVRPEGIVQPLAEDSSIPAADGLEPVAAECLSCRARVSVAARVCPSCGTAEPLSVDHLVRPTAPQPSSGPDAPNSIATPVRAESVLRQPIELAELGGAFAEETVLVGRDQLRVLVLHLESGESLTTNVPVVLGRQPAPRPGCDLVVIPSPLRELSRSHALVDVDERGHLTVVDLGSANGTRVDGQTIPAGERHTIAPGAGVELGDVLVRFELLSTAHRAAETAREGGRR